MLPSIPFLPFPSLSWFKKCRNVAPDDFPHSVPGQGVHDSDLLGNLKFCQTRTAECLKLTWIGVPLEHNRCPDHFAVLRIRHSQHGCLSHCWIWLQSFLD